MLILQKSLRYLFGSFLDTLIYCWFVQLQPIPKGGKFQTGETVFKLRVKIVDALGMV